MSNIPKNLMLAVALGSVALAAPQGAFAQGAGQIRQEERLVNVLLGQNQFRINHQENAIALQNALLARLPGGSAAETERLCNAINRLNANLTAAKPRLINGLNRTESALATLESAQPTNPVIASQLELFLQRANGIFSAELQQADFIINRPPATPVNCAMPPFGRGMSGMSNMSGMEAHVSQAGFTRSAAHHVQREVHRAATHTAHPATARRQSH